MWNTDITTAPVGKELLVLDNEGTKRIAQKWGTHSPSAWKSDLDFGDFSASVYWDGPGLTVVAWMEIPDGP